MWRAGDDADGRAPELLKQGTIDLIRWGWGSRRASKVCAAGLARLTEDEFRRHTFAQMAHELLHAALPNAGLVHRKVVQLQVDLGNLDPAECVEGRARARGGNRRGGHARRRRTGRRRGG